MFKSQPFKILILITCIAASMSFSSLSSSLRPRLMELHRAEGGQGEK